MSAEDTVAELISNAGGGSRETWERDVSLALQAVSKILVTTGDTFEAICTAVESAASKEQLQKAFGPFNDILQIFWEAFPEVHQHKLVLEALLTLKPSSRFAACLSSATSARDAATTFKSAVMQELAIVIRQKERRKRREKEVDDELFARFLPEPTSPPSDEMASPEDIAAIPKEPEVESGSLKRGISLIADSGPIPRKSKIPALAGLSRVIQGETSATASVQNVLNTREKLRAGMDDPRGLLNLVGSSSNALERTKRLELLKSAGHVFSPQRKKFSFVDKLNAAILRLELGLGAQSPTDTLLFGDKVLSSPGFLSFKHTSNIENNHVDGNTTWKHQHHYCKSMIAGCINQAKRIINMYDEVLFGPAPEAAVTVTHQAIRALLLSDEGKKFLSLSQEDDSGSVTTCDEFVKKIVGSVSPIIPIALRNKALDGCYLRTALNLIGCAEFLFSQYQTDIRDQANPNGLVGLSTGMHTEFKQSAVFATELPPLEVFMKDMRVQYQTSLGLGAPFPKDAVPRARRRVFRQGRDRGRNFVRAPAQGGSQYPADPADNTRSSLQMIAGGRGLADFGAMRNQGLCFAYQNGNCGRGRSCRFRHTNFVGGA